MGLPASPLLTIVVHDSARGTVGAEGCGRKRKRPGDGRGGGGGVKKCAAGEALAVRRSPRPRGAAAPPRDNKERGRSPCRGARRGGGTPRRSGTHAPDGLCGEAGEEGAAAAQRLPGRRLPPGGCSAACAAPARCGGRRQPAEMAAGRAGPPAHWPGGAGRLRALRSGPGGPRRGGAWRGLLPGLRRGSCPAGSRIQPLGAQLGGALAGRASGPRQGGIGGNGRQEPPAASRRRVEVATRGGFPLRSRGSPACGRAGRVACEVRASEKLGESGSTLGSLGSSRSAFRFTVETADSRSRNRPCSSASDLMEQWASSGPP